MMIFFTSISSSQPSYNATIIEGKTAAQEFIDNKDASAITIALVSPTQIIWNESFGSADPETGQHPTDTTMFGIGSISKLFATISIMKLVEQGVINLDEPLITYLPTFTMESPEYKNITVRMLLNHSAGLPGTDYRNSLLRSPYPDYLNQVLKTLSESRLKTPPGYINVYCNDCYTLTEALIAETTGKSYVQFVQDEILTPLGMNNTRYPLAAFPPQSYAKAYINGVTKPQEYVNTYASGGIYSTSKDMARIAMMLLNSGTVDQTRILSPASIAEMAKDQTIGTFNPVRNNSFVYGLGWDSVSQPGLLAVGFNGWAKGGDSNDYGSMIIVSPQAQLAVVVIGVSNFNSEKAKVVAERILLRALAENELIPEFPTRLTTPSLNDTLKLADTVIPNRQYASSNLAIKFQIQSNNTVLASILSDSSWGTELSMQKQNDDWFSSPQDPLNQFKAINTTVLGKPAQYLLKRSPSGYGHYFDTTIYAQKIEGVKKDISFIWARRLKTTWLVVNEHPDELTWNGMVPQFRLSKVPGSTNLIAVSLSEANTLQVVNPSTSPTKAIMTLNIPQIHGRDLNDLIVTKRDGKEWVRFGSYVYRPLTSVPVLPIGIPATITIGSEGYAEWRAIAVSNSSIQININTQGVWRLYNAAFKTIAHGKGQFVTTIPPGKQLNYLTFFGNPGDLITISTQLSG